MELQTFCEKFLDIFSISFIFYRQFCLKITFNPYDSQVNPGKIYIFEK